MYFPKKSAILRTLIAMLFGVIMFVFFGLVAMSIAMPHHTGMADCPYMVDMSSFCGMTADEHRGTWDTLAMGIIKRAAGLLLLVTIIVVAFWVFVRNLYDTNAPPGSPNAQYLRHHPDRIGFRNLSFAFSQGILHSKAW